MIYLDNAATSFPKPACVLREMQQCMCCFGANPGRSGHRLAAKAGETVFETRQSIADFFGGMVARTVFCGNCTHAINLALKGTLRTGDHVIISSLEHNAVLRPLERLRAQNGIEYDVLRIDPQNEAETLLRAKALIRPETRMLFVTHVSNVFGTVLPIRMLASLAKENGLLFGVDAAQSAGVFDLDLENDGIDLLCMPGHKGLFGPMGTGVLLFSERVLPQTLMEGGTGTLSLAYAQPEILPERYESGTLNLPGIAGLGAGLRFIRQYGGTQAIRTHEAELIRVLREDLSVIRSIDLFDTLCGAGEQTLLSFSLPDKESEEIAAMLDQCGFAVRAGYHCAALAHTMHGSPKGGTVRVSPSVFNTKKQIKNFSFCMNQIALRKFL